MKWKNGYKEQEEREGRKEGRGKGGKREGREGRKEGREGREGRGKGGKREGREEGTLVPRHSKESEGAPCAHCLRMHKVPLVTCVLLHCTKKKILLFYFLKL